jgi:hypothetical protein
LLTNSVVAPRVAGLTHRAAVRTSSDPFPQSDKEPQTVATKREELTRTKARGILFLATTMVVFLQIALGGLITYYNFSTPLLGVQDPATPHMITGFVVLALAIATMAVTLITKPAFRRLQGLSVGLVVLIVAQIYLGFVAVVSEAVAWVHLLTAVAIFGVAVSGTFMALGEGYARTNASA